MDNTLPPLYARWIRELLGWELAGEPRSQCGDCHMCRPPEIPTPLDRSFIPAAKCCTYMPSLPNFLVGAILADDDPAFAEGRALFEREAPVRGSVGPLGIGQLDAYRLMYELKQFGRIDSMQCPYLIRKDSGLCGIWRHRNAVCSTWFCTFERGRAGYDAWQLLRELLNAAERGLARWCIEELRLAVPEEPSGPREAIWGSWTGREREFYTECHRLVEPLPAEQVIAHAGKEARELLEKFRVACERLRLSEVPETLVRGKHESFPLGNGFTRVWSYSDYDPLDLADNVWEALTAFDGRPTAEVVESIYGTTGVRLGRVLLQKLVDTRILVPPGARDHRPQPA